VKGIVQAARTVLKQRAPGAGLGLLLLCSCATDNPARPPLPPAVAMNKSAGRGGPLIVTVRLPGGEELPLVVDCGTSGTLLDKSLEPQLGKPLGQVTVQSWGKYEKRDLCAAPKLYLGDVPLLTGSNVITMDFKQSSRNAGPPVMGFLGLDVLDHYCIQLDFAAGQVRFLDDARADQRKWGRAFPMVPLNSKDPRPAVAQNLLGAQGPHSLIDSGYMGDGWLMPEFYRQWTNRAVPAPAGEARSPNGRFGGETYPDVTLDEHDVESDGIGLRFLARHLVTLDFPKRTMYLKRTSMGPLGEEGAAAAVDFLRNQARNGKLPGWSKDEHGAIKGATVDHPSGFVTVSVLKNGDPSVYHYVAAPASKGGSWKLQKAWRTDETGRTVEAYPVP
jgi:hypothetical protein